jgi:hypothetical protein
LTLFNKKKGKDSSEFVSAYPYLQGNTLSVAIDSVLEWDNQLEATILCHVDDFHFAFFATDYYANRNAYVADTKILLNVSALGIKVRPGEDGFSFEGQQAIDFLAKLGQQPMVNANGEVQPIKFSTSELVAFLNKDEKCPDEAEFQSPFTNLEKVSILGVKFNKADIYLNRDNNVVVPIYYSESQTRDQSFNHSLSGWLWLMGRIYISKNEDIIDQLCAIGTTFTNAINSFDFKNFNELNFLLESLKDLSLPKDFDLDAVMVGDNKDSYMLLYATKNKRVFIPMINSKGEVTNTMEEDMYLWNTISPNIAKAISPLEKFLIVPNSIPGIWSAFLLYVSCHLLPLVGTAINLARDYIFSLEELDHISVNCTKFRNTEILPMITYTNENSGVLRVSYWSYTSGLIRDTFQFVWKHQMVKFTRVNREVLIEPKSSIIF